MGLQPGSNVEEPNLNVNTKGVTLQRTMADNETEVNGPKLSSIENDTAAGTITPAAEQDTDLPVASDVKGKETNAVSGNGEAQESSSNSNGLAGTTGSASLTTATSTVSAAGKDRTTISTTSSATATVMVSSLEPLINGNGWTPSSSSSSSSSSFNSYHPSHHLHHPQVTPPHMHMFTAGPNGNSGGSHRGQSPNRPGRYTPSPHSRGSSPNPGPGGAQAAPPPPPSVTTVGPAQHIVHLHVNPGEAISFQMGDQMQLIQGPATVRMVSNNTSPPIPMPVQVPPGHMVQQIVDENGTLRHVILSPQPPMTVPLGPTYAAAPAPSTGPASPHFYPYAHPPYGHPHPQYHPHPAGPHPHLQPGIPHQMHSHGPSHPHQCNSHHNHQGPSPPPPHHLHKDERTHRQIMKMKRKLEQKQLRDNSSISSHNTPPTSPRKDNGSRKYKDRHTSTSGLEDSEENHLDEEGSLLTELLSKILPPKVSDITARSALLQWNPPDMYSENGENKYNDFDIQESEFLYDILLSDKGKEGIYKSVTNCKALQYSYRLTDLKPATEYHICLNAILCLKGVYVKGNPSETIAFRTESCEPDPPQPPKVSNRTKTSLTLRWNTTPDNGSRITSYILEYDEGKGNGHFVDAFTGLQKQFKMTKLASSTCYRFRLSAVNDIGRSKASETVCHSTSGSTPSQPTPPQLKEAFPHQLHLIWQKRPNDEEFTLQMDDELLGHGFRPVYNGRDIFYVCGNLQRNTEYKFRLSANNEEGNSRWSDIVCFRTKPDKPNVPSKPVTKGRIHPHNFKVSWDPPRDNGGSEITKYNLEVDSGKDFELIYSGLDTEFVCDHLLPGTEYKVRVSCATAGGKSEYSEVCTVLTASVCPGQCAPPRLHGKPRATSLHLKWAAPDYDGGSPVTDFEIDMTSPDNTTRQAYRGRDTDCMVAGLLPGRPYLFQVRAHNRVGPGQWSEPLEVVSGAGPPDRPKEPRVVCKSPQHAVISWEEPVNNGATITEFRLEWSQKEGEFVQLYLGPGLSYDIKGLLPATQYNFRIQAINSTGAGAFSTVSSCVTPPSSPGAVSTSSIKCSCTATSIELSWKEPASHGSDILSYNIDLGERHPHLITVGNVLEWSIEDLQPETTYRIRIQAVNSVGVGPFSSTVKVTTLALPPAPPRLECVGVSHNSLKVKWGEGKNPDFTKYTLEMENRLGSFVPIYQGPSFSHKITKLSETTEYRLRIFATNAAGDGPCSEVYSFTTSKAPPPSLKGPKVCEVTENSCVVEWQAVKPMGEDQILYQIQLLNNRDQEYRLVHKGSELSHRIEGLEPKTEYHVRVGTIRQCRDGQGDLQGAFSPSTTFVTLSREPTRVAQPKPMVIPAVERRPLSDQQWAFIILFGFTLFAVLIAVVMQQLIAYNKVSSSSNSST